MEFTPQLEDYDVDSLEAIYNLSPDQTLEEQADEPLEFTKFGTLAARAAATREIIRQYSQDPRVKKEQGRYKNDIVLTKSSEDLIGRYFQEITQYDMLDKSTTVELFSQIEKGLKLYQIAGSAETTYAEEEQTFVDMTIAYQKVYLSNLRLVVHRAKKYDYAGFMPLMDIISEGNLGLTEAISRYDITKGFAFSTYATNWINQSIGRALADKSRIIRIPDDKHAQWLKSNKIHAKLTDQFNREPTTEEVASVMGLETENLEELRRIGATTLRSLNRPIRTNSEEEFGDFLPDTDSEKEDLEANEEMVNDIFITNPDLSDTAKQILSLRFGVAVESLKGTSLNINPKLSVEYDTIFSPSGLGITKLAEALRTSRRKIRAIEELALQELRKSSQDAA